MPFAFTSAQIAYRGYAAKRMLERGIKAADVHAAINADNVIEDYPTDTPYPSRLVLAFVNGQPLHVVWAAAPFNGALVVTAYIPDVDNWLPGFRERRPT